jgi:hypothetical protein
VLAEALKLAHENLVMPGLQQQAGRNITNTQGLIARGDTKLLADEIARLKDLPNKLNPLQRVLYDLNAQGVKVHTESLITELERALAAERAKLPPGKLKAPFDTTFIQNGLKAVSTAVSDGTGDTKQKIDTLTQQAQTQAAAQHAATIAGTALAAVQGTMQAVRDAVQTSTIRSSGTTAANASRSAGQGVEGELSALGNRIVGAIWAARPAPARVVVQSNTIIQKQAVSDRGGAASDSRTRGGV